MNENFDIERAVTLLKAARNLIKKCDEASYVVNVVSESVFYDGVDCDGYCLMEDIEYLLEDAGIKFEDN